MIPDNRVPLWIDYETLFLAISMRLEVESLEEMSKMIPEVSLSTLRRVRSGQAPSLENLLVLLGYAFISPSKIIRPLPTFDTSPNGDWGQG